MCIQAGMQADTGVPDSWLQQGQMPCINRCLLSGSNRNSIPNCSAVQSPAGSEQKYPFAGSRQSNRQKTHRVPTPPSIWVYTHRSSNSSLCLASWIELKQSVQTDGFLPSRRTSTAVKDSLRLITLHHLPSLRTRRVAPSSCFICTAMVQSEVQQRHEVRGIAELEELKAHAPRV